MGADIDEINRRLFAMLREALKLREMVENDQRNTRGRMLARCCRQSWQSQLAALDVALDALYEYALVKKEKRDE